MWKIVIMYKMYKSGFNLLGHPGLSLCIMACKSSSKYLDVTKSPNYLHIIPYALPLPKWATVIQMLKDVKVRWMRHRDFIQIYSLDIYYHNVSGLAAGEPRPWAPPPATARASWRASPAPSRGSCSGPRSRGRTRGNCGSAAFWYRQDFVELLMCA